jgi:crossover junction endodeoxyribonuclease RuvC
MRILGVDPGTDRVGFAVLDFEKQKFTYIASGTLPIESSEHAQKLLQIESQLFKIIKKYKPTGGGVEKLFFSKNQKTALAVAEARGVILKALAEKKLRIVEVNPNEIKMFLTGYGNADKRAVANMAQKFIGKSIHASVDDETDAIAVAITAAFRIG